MLYNFSYLLLPQQDTIYQENPPIEENTIISMILTEQFNNGGYTIVSPYTVMPERPDNTNPDYTNLIEHLFKINQTSEKLNLNSSPQNGYYIDYDEIFSRYQRIAGLSDVPLRWILFHPQAESSTKISKPAYDPETGYFLIYIQHVSSSIIRPGGSGGIYIYRYKDRELTLADYLWGWIR